MDTLSGSVKGIITSAYFSTQRGYESQNKHVFLDADVNDHLPHLLDKYSRTKQTQLLITSLSSVHSIRCGLLAKRDRFVGLWWKTYTLPVDTVQIPIIDLLSRHLLHQTRTEMQTYHLSTWFPKYTSGNTNRFVVGSSMCSTNPRLQPMATILTAIKDGQTYCNIVIHAAWILEISTQLLENLTSTDLPNITSIHYYYFPCSP